MENDFSVGCEIIIPEFSSGDFNYLTVLSDILESNEFGTKEVRRLYFQLFDELGRMSYVYLRPILFAKYDVKGRTLDREKMWNTIMFHVFAEKRSERLLHAFAMYASLIPNFPEDLKKSFKIANSGIFEDTEELLQWLLTYLDYNVSILPLISMADVIMFYQYLQNRVIDSKNQSIRADDPAFLTLSLDRVQSIINYLIDHAYNNDNNRTKAFDIVHAMNSSRVQIGQVFDRLILRAPHIFWESITLNWLLEKIEKWIITQWLIPVDYKWSLRVNEWEFSKDNPYVIYGISLELIRETIQTLLQLIDNDSPEKNSGSIPILMFIGLGVFTNIRYHFIGSCYFKGLLGLMKLWAEDLEWSYNIMNYHHLGNLYSHSWDRWQVMNDSGDVLWVFSQRTKDGKDDYKDLVNWCLTEVVYQLSFRMDQDPITMPTIWFSFNNYAWSWLNMLWSSHIDKWKISKDFIESWLWIALLSRCLCEFHLFSRWVKAILLREDLWLNKLNRLWLELSLLLCYPLKTVSLRIIDETRKFLKENNCSVSRRSFFESMEHWSMRGLVLRSTYMQFFKSENGKTSLLNSIMELSYNTNILYSASRLYHYFDGYSAFSWIKYSHNPLSLDNHWAADLHPNSLFWEFTTQWFLSLFWYNWADDPCFFESLGVMNMIDNLNEGDLEWSISILYCILDHIRELSFDKKQLFLDMFYTLASDHVLRWYSECLGMALKFRNDDQDSGNKLFHFFFKSISSYYPTILFYLSVYNKAYFEKKNGSWWELTLKRLLSSRWEGYNATYSERLKCRLIDYCNTVWISVSDLICDT